MEKEINFGIGFIAGRPNVCNIINSYYKSILEQVKELNVKVNFTFFQFRTLFHNSNSSLSSKISYKSQISTDNLESTTIS